MTETNVVAVSTDKNTYRWMDATASHPRCVGLLEKLTAAIAGTDLEIVESGDSFIVQGPENEAGLRKEHIFLFRAAANPDTDEWRVDQWIKRGIDIVSGRKPTTLPPHPSDQTKRIVAGRKITGAQMSPPVADSPAKRKRGRPPKITATVNASNAET